MSTVLIPLSAQRTRRLVTIIVAAAISATACAADVKPPSDSAAHLRVKNHHGSIIEQVCEVEVSLENSHDYPVWFLFSHGNRLLPYAGTFDGRGKHTKIPFGADEYNEGHGRAICVFNFTRDYFTAFCLPPRAHFHFGGFAITDSSPLRFVDVWEVRTLKVNGKTNLQEWLPYPSISDKAVDIAGTMWSGRYKVLDWEHDQNPTARPYPTEKVETIVAEPIRRQIFPLRDR